ncbi:hypothetical protein JI58_00090, partial [Marinosulfonomonas sp. PRT-SC04]
MLILALFNLFSNGDTALQSRALSYSDFVQAVEGGQVESATLDGENVTFHGTDGKDYATIRPGDSDVTALLLA